MNRKVRESTLRIDGLGGVAERRLERRIEVVGVVVGGRRSGASLPAARGSLCARERLRPATARHIVSSAMGIKRGRTC